MSETSPPRCPRCHCRDRVVAQKSGWFCDRCMGFVEGLRESRPCRSCAAAAELDEFGECAACAREFFEPLAKGVVVAKETAAGPLIEIDGVLPSPTNPRKTFDEGKLAELAESIKALGVLQPILVRPARGWRVVPGKSSGKPGFFCEHAERGLLDYFAKTEALAEAQLPRYELVAGERRLRAAKLAGLTRIPANIRELSDLQVLEAQLVENLQRDDVHPIEEAAGYQRLLDEHGYSVESIADRVSKSEGYVYGTLKLGKIPGAAQEAFRAGRLSKNHCVLIGRIPSDKLREKATDEILEPKDWAHQNRPDMKGEALSYREAKDLVEADFMCELKGCGFDRTSLTLVVEAGSCDACPKRTGNNRAEFPDARADVCTDPECFRAKQSAHRKAAEDRVANQGVKMLSGKDAKAALSPFSSKWQDLGEESWSDAKRRTYKQLVGKELKAETVAAVDARGKVHYLVPKERVNEVLGKDKNGRSAKTADHWEKERAKRAREDEVQALFVSRLLARVFADVRHQLGPCVGFQTPDVRSRLRAVLGAEMDEMDGEDVDSLGRVLDLPVDSNGILGQQILDQQSRELLALLICRTFLLRLRFGFRASAISELAKVFGIDAAEVEREARETVQARDKPAKAKPARNGNAKGAPA